MKENVMLRLEWGVIHSRHIGVRFHVFSSVDVIVSLRAHPFEVSGGLNLPDGLHEGVSDDDADVRTRVTVRLLAQSHEV